MITNEGKIYIKRYLAGWVPSIASSIAFGIGSKAEEVTDLKMHFEVGRANIVITSYDFTTNKLIFKAPLPDDFEGVIYEIGLFSQEKNALAGDFGSELISTFDSDTELWADPDTGVPHTYSATNARVGGDSLRLTVPAGGTVRAILEGIGLDFSGNTSADKFIMAYNSSANVSNIQLLLKTDESNYYTVTHQNTAGYRVSSASLGSAVPTGMPDWEEINMLEVRVTATSGGTATVDFDGIRIEDTDTPNPEYVMVSRELLGTPFIKEAGRIQAIEFALDVAV